MLNKADYQELERIIDSYLSGRSVYNDGANQGEVQDLTIKDWQLLDRIMELREQLENNPKEE